jgi:hypothetical protein
MKMAFLVSMLMTYTLSAGSVLRRVADARDDLKVNALRIDGLATLSPRVAKEVAGALSAPYTSGELALTAVTSIQFPARCRIDISSPSSTKVVSAIWNNEKKRTEGVAVKSLEIAVEQLCALLALRGADAESRAKLEAHLVDKNIDGRKVSYGRFEGQVAYVLGEREAASAQFWVYKDKFLPARMKFTEGKDAWDVRFIDYTSPTTSDWHPRLVEVFLGDELQLKLTVVSADGKADLSEVKF